MDTFALQMLRIEKYTDDQQVALNGLIDREAQSRTVDRSIPGMIDTTTPSTSIGDTTEMTTLQALITSLTTTTL